MARTALKKAKTSRSKANSKRTAGTKKTAVKKGKTAAKRSAAPKRRIVHTRRIRGAAATTAIRTDAIHTTLTGPERVARAKALLEQGSVYEKGCSGFVCDVLQITYRQAKDLMAGSDIPANSIGRQPNYANVNPGDVCGWLKADDANVPQDDHVTIWIGEPGMRFIDVQRPGGIPRKLGNGYELNQTLWKSKNV